LLQVGSVRLGCALESGVVPRIIGSRIEQRGNVDHQVNPGGKGGKFLEVIVPFLAG
jgi:hypothetical protein